MPAQLVQGTTHSHLAKMTPADAKCEFAQPQGNISSFTVPTVDPFSRGIADKKPLNPGSCSSAMNLLAFGSIGSAMRTVLNPKSGLDLLNGLQGQGSRHGSMASMSSVVSDASQLLRAIQGNVSQSSLFSSSASGLALLLGDFPTSGRSASSSERRGDNKNNAGVCRRGEGQASSSNRNADWGVFK